MNVGATPTAGGRLSRRLALACLASPQLSGLPAAQAADDAGIYPTPPINILIGFPPGGSTDGPVRMLAVLAPVKIRSYLLARTRFSAMSEF